jgi:DNA polymerase-3 subunit alpha
VNHNEGVIVLSGCPDGVPVKGESLFVEEFGVTLKHVFGDRFYAEIMFTMPDIWKKQLAFADKFELPIVFTADAHFLRPGDHKLHSSMNKLLRGYSFPNNALYLHSREDMRQRAIDNEFPIDCIEEGLDNTLAIADRIEEFEVSHPVELPAPKSAKKDLMRAINQRKLQMIDDGVWNDKYAKRLKHESNVITRMNFWDYFWMVYKVVEYGKKAGIKLGHGRGSAAGSLVVYLLGITTVDPIKHNLIFERFLNIARKGVVDIDLDWEAARRDEVIEFAHNKWGALPLITISTYSHKSLINDLVKVFKINNKDKDKYLSDETSQDFSDYRIVHPAFDYAYSILIGGVRHRGKHASGFAITRNKNLPVERMKGDNLSYGVPLASSQYDDLTPWGATKFDLLGLTSLSALARMEELTGDKVK